VTAVVEVSPAERVRIWTEHLATLTRARNAKAAERDEVRAEQRAELLNGAETTLYRARAKDLSDEVKDLDEEIAWLTADRDALRAKLEAQERAERLARAHTAAVAEARRSAEACTAWVSSMVVMFNAPDHRTLDAGRLMAAVEPGTQVAGRDTQARSQLASVRVQLGGNVQSISPTDLIGAVANQLPIGPPRRALFLMAVRGDRAGVLRMLADLETASGRR
jgi:hypothetical protein